MRATEQAPRVSARADHRAGDPDAHDTHGDPASGPDPRIAAAVAAIETAETPPRLGELARRAGLSPSHFQRLFSREVGLSPTQYGIAVRRARLHGALARSQSVIEAIFDAGFGSSSQAYAVLRTEAGMTPSLIRAGGRGMDVAYIGIAVGARRLHLAFTTRGLCHLSLGNACEETAAALERLLPCARLEPLRDLELRARVLKTVAAIGGALAAASGPRERVLVEQLRRRLATLSPSRIHPSTTPVRLPETGADPREERSTS